MITFQDISTKSDGCGLKHLNLTIDQANLHILTVLDTNTLMELFDVLTCRKEPSSGVLLLDGAPYREVKGLEYIQSGLGHAIRELTPAQNIFGLRQKTLLFRRRAAEMECQELIDRFGFSLRAGETLLMASEENLRIVELLRCYVGRPKILILNELFDVFSFRNMAIARDVLSEMRMRNTHVVYITRKFDDIFKIGDLATVFRDGHYVDTLSRAEIMQQPHILYEALLGGDSVLRKDQFGAENEEQDILSVVNIGTQCMFAQENLSTALGKYAHVTEKYFGDVRCVIYLRNEEKEDTYRTAFSVERREEDIPFADRETIRQLFHMDSFYTLTRAAPSDNRDEKGFLCDTWLFAKILGSGQAIGILQVAFPTGHTLTKKEIDYLRVTCNEIAIIIGNAQLIGRSAFLQEGHHRIKNNLQLITSMLILQKNAFRQKEKAEFSHAEVDAFIDTTINRIQSIAGIHDMLSRAVVRDELVTLRAILAEIQKFYAPFIEMNFDIQDNVPIPHLKATAVALVINEIIGNSVKHNIGKPGLRCCLSAQMEERTVLLHYQDNGRGIDPKTVQKKPGIGMTLIRTIVTAELEGSYRMGNNESGGVLLEIFFSLPSLY